MPAAEARESALVLAPEPPYPLAGGGALRTASILHYLARKYVVDLIVFRQPGAPDPAACIPEGLVRAVHAIDLPGNRRSVAARALRNTLRVARQVPPLVDRFSGFESAIRCATEGATYAVGVIEHSWCAPYRDEIARVCSRTVLDLHNVESVLHDRCAASESGAVGLAHKIFGEASRELERTWLPGFSTVLTTSEVDAAAVRAIAPGTETAVYPNAIPTPPARPAGNSETQEEAIVFSGNMEYHPNRSAVRFFRTEIWPLIRERCPRLIWRLVGRNPEAVREFTSGDPRIEATGPVEDAIGELARARVAVVPIIAGSGTRLKILEAWGAELAVVSTRIGAEGLPVRNGEHLILADTAEGFADSVSRLLACSDTRSRLGMAGRSLLEKEFTWEAAWKKLLI